MGANALRMSHNPPSPVQLDWADRLGLLVLDETRSLEATPEALADMRALVTRDRQHPSVIMWSLCNEGGCWLHEPEAGRAVGRQYAALVAELDGTRPVTAAFLGDLQSVAEGWTPAVVDVIGFNYAMESFGQYSTSALRDRPVLSTESGSCVSARGQYTTDAGRHLSDVYGAHACMREWWTTVARHDFVIGGFVWTGFDYKGEPRPWDWPSVLSSYGIFDHAGFPKDAFWYYQAQWQVALPTSPSPIQAHLPLPPPPLLPIPPPPSLPFSPPPPPPSPSPPHPPPIPIRYPQWKCGETRRSKW